MSRATPPLLLLFITVLAGCADEAAAPPQRPVVETRADSAAMLLYGALGGPGAWNALPYLRFDFAVGRGGARRPVAHHLWNRQTGAYRLEWSAGADSSYVAPFDVDTREGQVYLNGVPVDSARNAELLDHAYGRFINDTYWMLAPTKLFDPGVTRTYVADSSSASVDVIRLTFDDVGLTPGDRYWLYVDAETGLLQKWAYHLQSMPDTATARTFRWTGYEQFDTPQGPIRIATRKEALGGEAVIYTDQIAVPTEVPDSLFVEE